ncbi:MAG TPA: EAL domain-containing protein [Vicinamibacteria bacterium]|nr:EAL domain-containing protein [Vicinamibacteria bacterium]
MLEPTPDTTTAAPPAPLRGRVLVVEDDRGLLEVYADVLLEAGFDVAAASSGTGALHALDRDAFDVVLTDVVMPGCTGLDILRAVRERDLDVPVVLVTGNPSVESAVVAVEMGALHYLVKPVGRDELIRCVEHASRLRKLAGVKRDALRYLGHADRPAGDRAGLEAVFARALGGLFMAYQPIMRTLDGSVFGWEALLRTKEPAITGPLAFLEAAERLGRVGELGRLIRASVARTANQRRGMVFFINLHPDDLLDEALFDPSAPLSALAPQIVLEITEQSPFDSILDVRDRVRRLRSLGFRLAVDDLGSGYAGLTSFAVLEPEFVKLDRGLVQGLDSEPVKRKLVASIVAVSRELGITAVAEGIETAAERAAVAGLGCHLMQGFFFRHPERWRDGDGVSLAAEGA